MIPAVACGTSSPHCLLVVQPSWPRQPLVCKARQHCSGDLLTGQEHVCVCRYCACACSKDILCSTLADFPYIQQIPQVSIKSWLLTWARNAAWLVGGMLPRLRLLPEL